MPQMIAIKTFTQQAREFVIAHPEDSIAAITEFAQKNGFAQFGETRHTKYTVGDDIEGESIGNTFVLNADDEACVLYTGVKRGIYARGGEYRAEFHMCDYKVLEVLNHEEGPGLNGVHKLQHRKLESDMKIIHKTLNERYGFNLK